MLLSCYRLLDLLVQWLKGFVLAATGFVLVVFVVGAGVGVGPAIGVPFIVVSCVRDLFVHCCTHTHTHTHSDKRLATPVFIGYR